MGNSLKQYCITTIAFQHDKVNVCLHNSHFKNTCSELQPMLLLSDYVNTRIIPHSAKLHKCRTFPRTRLYVQFSNYICSLIHINNILMQHNGSRNTSYILSGKSLLPKSRNKMNRSSQIEMEVRLFCCRWIAIFPRLPFHLWKPMCYKASLWEAVNYIIRWCGFCLMWTRN